MKKFRATFYGRRKGAIGMFYTFNEVVEAGHAEEVRMKLYESFEHISSLYVLELTEVVR